MIVTFKYRTLTWRGAHAPPLFESIHHLRIDHVKPKAILRLGIRIILNLPAKRYD